MWGVAYVIAMSKTSNISDWIKNQLKNEHPTFQRRGLVGGLPIKGGFKNDNELKNFLNKVFDKYPLDVLELFKKIRTRDDIHFLEEKIKPIERPESRDIKKLIVYLDKEGK